MTFLSENQWPQKKSVGPQKMRFWIFDLLFCDANCQKVSKYKPEIGIFSVYLSGLTRELARGANARAFRGAHEQLFPSHGVDRFRIYLFIRGGIPELFNCHKRLKEKTNQIKILIEEKLPFKDDLELWDWVAK